MQHALQRPLSQHVPDRPLEGLSSPSSLPTLPITITHSTLVRQAPSLVTGDEQNQCCWQGRHELQAWRIESLPTLYHALPPQLLSHMHMHHAHAYMHTCSPSYAVHPRALVLKLPRVVLPVWDAAADRGTLRGLHTAAVERHHRHHRHRTAQVPAGDARAPLDGPAHRRRQGGHSKYSHGKSKVFGVEVAVSGARSG